MSDRNAMSGEIVLYSFKNSKTQKQTTCFYLKNPTSQCWTFYTDVKLESRKPFQHYVMAAGLTHLCAIVSIHHNKCSWLKLQHKYNAKASAQENTHTHVKLPSFGTPHQMVLFRNGRNVQCFTSLEKDLVVFHVLTLKGRIATTCYCCRWRLQGLLTSKTFSGLLHTEDLHRITASKGRKHKGKKVQWTLQAMVLFVFVSFHRKFEVKWKVAVSQTLHGLSTTRLAGYSRL